MRAVRTSGLRPRWRTGDDGSSPSRLRGTAPQSPTAARPYATTLSVVLVQALAACSSAPSSTERYAHAMGWREGTVHAVILGAQLKSSDAPTCDQLDRDTAGANRAYAVVRTRVGRPSTDFIVPVPADRELQVGDRVMANRSSCAPVVVLRSVHVGEASGASGN